MSEDRIRRAFDDVSHQAGQADPEPSLANLTNGPTRNRFLFVGTAAALVVLVGFGAFFLFSSPNTDAVAPTTIDPSPSSLAPVPDETTPDETSPPTTVQSTTTTQPPSWVAPWAGGWRVVNVASDDVLNVRSEPNAQATIVAALQPNAENVTVIDNWRGSFGDEPHWAQVKTNDGVEGWVNAFHLQHPDSWTDGLAGVECWEILEGDAAFPFERTGNATKVLDIFDVTVGTCTKHVILLGRDEGTFAPATRLGGPGIRLSQSGNIVTLELPPQVDVTQGATAVQLDNALALIVDPLDDPERDHFGGFEVHFLHDQPVHVRSFGLLDSPARVVVEVEAKSDSSPNLAPIRAEEGFTVVRSMDLETGPQGSTVTVTGYASWFEAQGFAEVLTIDGEPPTDIIWSGPSVGPISGNSAGVYAPWFPAWGEFSFTVSVTTGSYTLFVGDHCFIDPEADDDVSEPCGVTQTFDVEP